MFHAINIEERRKLTKRARFQQSSVQSAPHPPPVPISFTQLLRKNNNIIRKYITKCEGNGEKSSKYRNYTVYSINIFDFRFLHILCRPVTAAFPHPMLFAYVFVSLDVYVSMYLFVGVQERKSA